MTESPFEMKFDPLTVKHLGLKMYSQLPAALAEIISNSYDAYSRKVGVVLREKGGVPLSIEVMDDGIGLTSEQINTQFLIIGRNRREDKNIEEPPFVRHPTGKKGLGKLALFGMAKVITIETVKDGLLNEFILNYDDLLLSKGSYRPTAKHVDIKTAKPSGTKVTLTELKRVSPFDTESLIDSLSRIFLIDDNFEIAVASPEDDVTIISNERKYDTINKEFIWQIEDMEEIKNVKGHFSSIVGTLITSVKPIPPSSGLRGITLYSRGKLVNLPEFFSESTSSHFYSYLTGWIKVDFIDDLDEDVISTNRQSLVWDTPTMSDLRSFLKSLVSKISIEWREKRKKKKQESAEEITGIDTEKWVDSVPDEMKSDLEKLLEALSGPDVAESYGPAVKALHSMVPDYPLLHWRHLHPKLKERVSKYYKNEQYGEAADQGAKIYCAVIREITGSKLDGRKLMEPVFSGNPPRVRINDFKTESDRNIQEGQALLSKGLMVGFRNPVSHDAIDDIVPQVFTELDCLNILSLTSHLLYRLDGAVVDDLEYFKTH